MVTSDEIFKKVEAMLATIDPNDRKVLHVYKFVITDDSGSVLKSWILDLVNVKLYESTTDEAEVTLTASESVLIALATRQIELKTALTDGTAKVEGNLELLKLLKEHAGSLLLSL